jgi:predicted DNA-binding protein
MARNSVYVSMQLTSAEKEILDEAVKRSGKTRNRFLRDWINSLWQRP